MNLAHRSLRLLAPIALAFTLNAASAQTTLVSGRVSFDDLPANTLGNNLHDGCADFDWAVK